MKLPRDGNVVSIEFNALEKGILKKLKEVFYSILNKYSKFCYIYYSKDRLGF